jgi:hypothetical protein
MAFNIAAFPPLIVSGALLICIICIFWMWVSMRKTRRRLKVLEDK